MEQSFAWGRAGQGCLSHGLVLMNGELIFLLPRACTCGGGASP